jgi:hypothetical protein
MAYQLSLAPPALAYELVKISPEYFGCLHLPRRVDIQLRADGVCSPSRWSSSGSATCIEDSVAANAAT